MTGRLLTTISACCLMCTSATAIADPAGSPDVRLALVIGEQYYQGAALEAPDADAVMIADSLRSQDHFQVTLLTDAPGKKLGIKDLQRAVDKFAISAKAASDSGSSVTLVFYFAGHGVEKSGTNFLIPSAAANLLSATGEITDYKTDALVAQAVLDQLDRETGAARVILVLDACRTTPKALRSIGGGGLAPMIAPTDHGDTLIVFSTQPNEPAADAVDRSGHSPFAEALAANLKEPGLPASEVFSRTSEDVERSTAPKGDRQRPWIQGTPISFYFKTGDRNDIVRARQEARAEGLTLGRAEALSSSDSLSEPKLWATVVQSNEPAAYQIYLSFYAAGPHSAEAKQRQGSHPIAAPSTRPPSPDGLTKARAALASVSDQDWSTDPSVQTAVKVFSQVSADELQSLADGGDARAQQLIGFAHFAGFAGLVKNDDTALLWFRKAAQNGNARAETDIGVAYLSGRGVSRDIVQAKSWFQKAAHQGDAVAQADLGRMYLYAQGVPRDYVQALVWLRKAAEQGNAPGQFNLGSMYKQGLGVPRDYAEAQAWFRKAADQGHPFAQAELGSLYEGGLGVSRDYIQAAAWYRLATDQNNPWGQASLGELYASGHGVPQDYAMALALFRKAADQGDSGGQNDLGVLYENGLGVPQDFAQALAWFRKAADQGNAKAEVNLSWLYENGRGVPQDYAAALAWTRKSADHGEPRGENHLGMMYEAGHGVPQDYAQAAGWYLKAALQGLPPAQYALAVLYTSGLGVPKNSSEARQWMQKAASQSYPPAIKAMNGSPP